MTESNPIVGFVGFGRFARAMSSLLRDCGISFYYMDPASNSDDRSSQVASHAELCDKCNYIVLALPVNRVADALKKLVSHLTPQHIVFDVGSVKVRPEQALLEHCSDRIPWVATHPLFGPTSLALAERPLHVIVCPNAMFPQQVTQVCDLYRQLGCEPVMQSAAEHDRTMADSHALAFYIAKGMIEAGINLNNPYAPPSFQAIARTAFVVRSDAGHLFTTIECENPFAAQARQKFVQALQKIEQEIKRSVEIDSDQNEDAQLAIADLGTSAPFHQSTEKLIEELDLEIRKLVDRRTELMQRMK